MTRESAKSKIRMSVIVDGKHINSLKKADEVIDKIFDEHEALQQRSCKTCKYYDTERPRSHPNYAECNKRDCPLSYVEVHYAFCCSEHTPK